MTDSLSMFDVIHLPICIDCKKDVLFVQDQGVVVGKCGCVKDRVMTERQYIFFESFDVISQSIILAGSCLPATIEFKGELGFEMDRSVVLDKLLWWKVVRSL